MKLKVKSLSRVRFLATPWTAAYQAPPSMGFSRQESWSGVPLPSPTYQPSEGQLDLQPQGLLSTKDYRPQGHVFSPQAWALPLTFA